MPPWNEIWDLSRYLLAPGIITSLVVMGTIRIVGSERKSQLAAGLALITAVLAANFYRDAISLQVEENRPFSVSVWIESLAWSLEGKPADVSPDRTPPPTRFWLPWMTCLAIAIELLGSCLPPSAPLREARVLVSLIAGRILTPLYLRQEHPWLPWILGLVILAEWTIFTVLTRRFKDGIIPLASALCCAGAAIVALHAHSLRYTDIALFFFVGMLGPTIIATFWPGDTSPALAGIAVLLPSLQLLTFQETFSQVSVFSFLWLGIAPLLLIPLIYWKTQRWLALLLILNPVVIGVCMAMGMEKLTFD